MPSFPEKFEVLRRRSGVTIRNVASELKVGVGTVGGWAKGSVPRPEVARRLADLFKLPVDILLDDTKELPPEVLPPGSRLGPKTRAIVEEIGPHKKWREVSPEDRGRAFGAIIEESPEIQALTQELTSMLPTIKRWVQIMEQLNSIKNTPKK